MLAKLRALFSSDDPDQPEAIRPELAAASLMLEVSWADHELSTQELEAVATLLTDLYPVNAEQAQLLIDDAQARLQTNVGLHPYTSHLNEHLDEAGRFAVIRAMAASSRRSSPESLRGTHHSSRRRSALRQSLSLY